MKSINLTPHLKGKSVSLPFGNDMSRIVRGVAIILMVCNHSLPGKVIGFAVPLFSFLVGYGYAFAKNKDFAHSARRIWHLLKDYWFVIFAIALPTALLTYPRPIDLKEFMLCLFGLNGRLNFYAWYIYFYIFSMLLLPFIYQLIARKNVLPTLMFSAACGLVTFGIGEIAGFDKNIVLSALSRCFRYFPIVLMGFWIASNGIFRKFYVTRNPWIPIGCVALLVGIYVFRSSEYIRIGDFLWAPVAALIISIPFTIYVLKPLRFVLTELGLKSMNIWFLHALFFTHSTKSLFSPLVSWISWKPAFVLAILILSYLMAIVVGKIIDWISSLSSRMSQSLATSFKK